MTAVWIVLIILAALGAVVGAVMLVLDR